MLEQLEGRSLPAVIATVDAAGLLRIDSDANDAIAVSSVDGSVRINGADPVSGPFASADVAALEIVCASLIGENWIDLHGIVPTIFRSLTHIALDGGGGDDLLAGMDIDKDWFITSADAGTILQSTPDPFIEFTFISVECVLGGPGADRFVFSDGAALSGFLDGSTGADTLDLGDLVGNLAARLTGSGPRGFGGDVNAVAGGFRGIDALIGGTGADTLTGEDIVSIWSLEDIPSYGDGTATLVFSAFETLHGGTLADTFNLFGDALGTVTADLRGAAGDDAFVLHGATTLVGTIDGQDGADTLSYASYASSVNVALSGSTRSGVEGAEFVSGAVFGGIDILIGSTNGNGPDHLTGADKPTTWTLDATPTYDDNTAMLAFSAFEVVQGGLLADVFAIDEPEAREILGGDGNDTFTVARTSPGLAVILLGGAGNDSFVVNAPGAVRLIRSQVTMDGEEGQNSLLLDNEISVQPDTVTITPTDIGVATGDHFFGPGGGLTYRRLSLVALTTSSGVTGDVIRLTPSPTTEFFIHGGPPTSSASGDTLQLDLTGVTGETLVNTTPDRGRYTFTNRQPVNFTGIEPSTDIAINGTGENDVLFIFRTPGGVAGDITYILNDSAPVVLMGADSFSFNGLGGDDVMNVQLPPADRLVIAGLTFWGGPGVNALNFDANGQHVHVGDIFSASGGQKIKFVEVQTTYLNNTSAVNSYYGPNTADRPAAFNGRTAQQRFVQAMYLNALGRAGSTSELDDWVAQLDSPRGAAAVAGGIERSIEARDHLVRTWYMTYLHREAFGGEQLGWTNALISGQSEERILSGILASDEFFARSQTLISSGTSADRFVKALYQVLLDRTGSAREAEGWIVGLPEMGPRFVVLGFLESVELREYMFRAHYASFLHRPEDDGGLAGWTASGADFTQARIYFESSTEFFRVG